jgi:hypothetical protein
VVGIKVFNWYQHKSAHNILNEKYPIHEGVVPVDRNALVFAQWGLDKYPTIADLWNNRDEVFKELQELRPIKHVPELGSYRWGYVARLIKNELRAATAVRNLLSRYTTYDKKDDVTLASMTQDQLNTYYAAIKIKEAAKSAEVSFTAGAFECSSQYASNVAHYVLGKAQQLAAWVTRKPTIAEATKNRFVAVLKGYHRLEILNAILDRATKAEDEKQAQKREDSAVAAVAPVVHDVQ